MKWISKAFYFVNGLAFFLMIASCFSVYLDPSDSKLLVLLGASFPIFLLINCLFIVYWLIIEPKRIVLSLAALAICFNSVRAVINYSGSDQSQQKGLSLLSYNIGGTFFLPKEEKEKKMKWIPKEIDHIQPDIIAFQESSMVRHMRNDLLEYDSHHFSTKGTSLYSKLPILNKGKIDFGGLTNSAVWIDIKKDDQRIRVYSIHLQSNQISKNELTSLSGINSDYEESLKDSKNVFSKYSSKVRARVEQVKIILNHVSKSPYPVIVMGDFNEPSYSYVYKQMTKDLKDSFISKGSGIGSTFNGKIPFLRIDYAFVDAEIEVLSHEVLDWELSDHFPILVQIAN